MTPVLPPAEVEVDSRRRYIWVNDAACELLGYSRSELLSKTIDDISYPSGAHVGSMFAKFENEGAMSGIFALRRKSGQGIMIRFESEVVDGHPRAKWTHFQPVEEGTSE